MTAEKAASETKKISRKLIWAIAAANHRLGAGNALIVAGFTCLAFGLWLRDTAVGRIPEEIRKECES